MKKSRIKIDRDRSSNIPFRNQASMRGVVVNDIATAMKGHGELSTVPVSYSNVTLLNTPSIALEDLPTEGHQANSEMQAVLNDLTRDIKAQEKSKTNID